MDLDGVSSGKMANVFGESEAEWSNSSWDGGDKGHGEEGDHAEEEFMSSSLLMFGSWSAALPPSTEEDEESTSTSSGHSHWDQTIWSRVSAFAQRDCYSDLRQHYSGHYRSAFPSSDGSPVRVDAFVRLFGCNAPSESSSSSRDHPRGGWWTSTWSMWGGAVETPAEAPTRTVTNDGVEEGEDGYHDGNQRLEPSLSPSLPYVQFLFHLFNVRRDGMLDEEQYVAVHIVLGCSATLRNELLFDALRQVDEDEEEEDDEDVHAFNATSSRRLPHSSTTHSCDGDSGVDHHHDGIATIDVRVMTRLLHAWKCAMENTHRYDGMESSGAALCTPENLYRVVMAITKAFRQSGSVDGSISRRAFVSNDMARVLSRALWPHHRMDSRQTLVGATVCHPPAGMASMPWKRALQLMWGIRYCVHQTKHVEMNNRLVPDDYSTTHMATIPSWMCTALRKEERAFVAYAPSVFHCLRRSWGISNESYETAFSIDAALGGFIAGQLWSPAAVVSPGRSGSEFFRSVAGEMMAKSIRLEERDALLEMLPDYVNHMRDRPDSLINRMYGLYSIGSRTYLVMEYLFPPDKPPCRVFDLKGSHVRRKSPTPAVGMDQDFDAELGGILVSLESHKCLGAAIDADTALLEKHGMMDYSLLVGVHLRRWKCPQCGHWNSDGAMRCTSSSPSSSSSSPSMCGALASLQCIARLEGEEESDASLTHLFPPNASDVVEERTGTHVEIVLQGLAMVYTGISLLPTWTSVWDYKYKITWCRLITMLHEVSTGVTMEAWLVCHHIPEDIFSLIASGRDPNDALWTQRQANSCEEAIRVRIGPRVEVDLRGEDDGDKELELCLRLNGKDSLMLRSLLMMEEERRCEGESAHPLMQTPSSSIRNDSTSSTYCSLSASDEDVDVAECDEVSSRAHDDDDLYPQLGSISATHGQREWPSLLEWRQEVQHVVDECALWEEHVEEEETTKDQSTHPQHDDAWVCDGSLRVLGAMGDDTPPRPPPCDDDGDRPERVALDSTSSSSWTSGLWTPLISLVWTSATAESSPFTSSSTSTSTSSKWWSSWWSDNGESSGKPSSIAAGDGDSPSMPLAFHLHQLGGGAPEKKSAEESTSGSADEYPQWAPPRHRMRVLCGSGVHGHVELVVGIIDVLTIWNAKKRIEGNLKFMYNFTNGHKISAINPKAYGERFRKSVDKRFRAPKERSKKGVKWAG